MTRDELIKVAAKAYIDDGEHYISDAPRITWLDLPSSQRNEVRKGISAALSAIEAAGYAVALVEPTEEMREAGFNKFRTERFMSDCDQGTRIYAAMLAASPLNRCQADAQTSGDASSRLSLKASPQRQNEEAARAADGEKK